MPPNIVTQFVVGTPPITRVLVFLIMLTTLLVYLNVLQPHQLTYSRFYVPKLQLYRALTTFLYFGRLNLEIALHIVFLYRYSLMLEESFTRTSDYFYMLLVISALLFVLSNVYYIPLLGPSLSCTITYIWTRKNPQTVVQIMGFVSFYAFYLPFIVPMFTLVFEGKVSMEEIVGIIVGHIVYYLQDVYPRFGRTVLTTPCWCHRLFNERGPCCAGARRVRPRASQRLGDIQVSREMPGELPAGRGTPVSGAEAYGPSNADSSSSMPEEYPAAAQNSTGTPHDKPFVAENAGPDLIENDWVSEDDQTVKTPSGEAGECSSEVCLEPADVEGSDSAERLDSLPEDAERSDNLPPLSTDPSFDTEKDVRAGDPRAQDGESSASSEFEVISVPDDDLKSAWLDSSNEEKWGSEDIN